ncbi:hypothetical protein [Halocatena halophila]|uniref:hypothetical protein n=1 Tax=Halocatena halophila TaxID=2814576 RepID=UPI002ED61D61
MTRRTALKTTALSIAGIGTLAGTGNAHDLCCCIPVEDCHHDMQTYAGQFTLGYEDWTLEKSDWDYNDFLLTVDASYTVTEAMDNTANVTEMTLKVVPQARGGGANHSWHLLFSGDLLCSGGTYEITVKDQSGEPIGAKSSDGSFEAESELDLEVFPDTADFLTDLQNGEPPEKFDGCTMATEMATISLSFDSPCTIDLPDSELLGTHGEGLFFDPYLHQKMDGTEIHQDDIRMLVVPEQWRWPLGNVHIADAYADVSRGHHPDEYKCAKPVFESSDWYKSRNILDSSLVTECTYTADDFS